MASAHFAWRRLGGAGERILAEFDARALGSPIRVGLPFEAGWKPDTPLKDLQSIIAPDGLFSGDKTPTEGVPASLVRLAEFERLYLRALIGQGEVIGLVPVAEETMSEEQFLTKLPAEEFESAVALVWHSGFWNAGHSGIFGVAAKSGPKDSQWGLLFWGDVAEHLQEAVNELVTSHCRWLPGSIEEYPSSVLVPQPAAFLFDAPAASGAGTGAGSPPLQLIAFDAAKKVNVMALKWKQLSGDGSDGSRRARLLPPEFRSLQDRELDTRLQHGFEAFRERARENPFLAVPGYCQLKQGAAPSLMLLAPIGLHPNNNSSHVALALEYKPTQGSYAPKGLLSLRSAVFATRLVATPAQDWLRAAAEEMVLQSQCCASNVDVAFSYLTSASGPWSLSQLAALLFKESGTNEAIVGGLRSMLASSELFDVSAKDGAGAGAEVVELLPTTTVTPSAASAASPAAGAGISKAPSFTAGSGSGSGSSSFPLALTAVGTGEPQSVSATASAMGGSTSAEGSAAGTGGLVATGTTNPLEPVATGSGNTTAFNQPEQPEAAVPSAVAVTAVALAPTGQSPAGAPAAAPAPAPADVHAGGQAEDPDSENPISEAFAPASEAQRALALAKQAAAKMQALSGPGGASALPYAYGGGGKPHLTGAGSFNGRPDTFSGGPARGFNPAAEPFTAPMPMPMPMPPAGGGRGPGPTPVPPSLIAGHVMSDPWWPGQKLFGDGFFSTPFDGVGALSLKRGFAGQAYFIDIPERDAEKGYKWPRPAVAPSVPYYSGPVTSITDPLLKAMLNTLPPQQIEGTYLAFSLTVAAPPVPTNVRCCIAEGVVTKWFPRATGRGEIFMMGAIQPDLPYPGADQPRDVYFDQRSMLSFDQVYGSKAAPRGPTYNGSSGFPIGEPIPMDLQGRRVTYAVRHGKQGFTFEWAAIAVVALPRAEGDSGAPMPVVSSASAAPAAPPMLKASGSDPTAYGGGGGGGGWWPQSSGPRQLAPAPYPGSLAPGGLGMPPGGIPRAYQ